MKPVSIKPILTLTALTGGATAAIAAVILFNPGPAFTSPRLLVPTTVKAALPAAGSYTIDPAHTFLGFEIQHMGLSRVQGRFDDNSGKIIVDPRDLSQSSVTLTAKVASIDTHVAPRDNELRGDGFFDVAKYPTLTFQSTKISKHGNHYIADGNLTIKDVTKPVSLSFQFLGPVQDPFGSVRIGVLVDPIVINREDYHVAWERPMPDGSPQISDDVTVRISAEATKDK